MESSDLFHILFVEDDEVDIQSVQRELKKITVPIKLHLAKNGAEALDMLQGRNGQQKLLPLPKMILLDINMPKMNGVEFLKKMRAEEEFKLIPVYILTTAYTTNDKLATQNLNVTGCIVKPLQFQDLLNMYWALLGMSSY